MVEMIKCEGCGTFFEPGPRAATQNPARFCTLPCFNRTQRRTAEDLKQALSGKRQVDPVRGCWLWTGQKSRSGYGKVRFNGRHLRVHRLAAHLFNGFDLDSEKVVCHRCDRPACFNPDHLFEGENADNVADRDAKGRHQAPVGAAHGHAKLSEAEAIEILKLHKTGVSQSALAKQFGVSRPTVTLLVNGKTWRHLPRE